MSGFQIKGVDIATNLLTESSSSTTDTGFRYNGNDLTKIYRPSSNSIGISKYVLNSYTTNITSRDLSTFLYNNINIVSSSTATYTLVELSLGFYIWIKSSGIINFGRNLKSFDFKIIGGGGSGGQNFGTAASGGGGGAGEIVRATYTSSTNTISSITATIGEGGVNSNGGSTRLLTNGSHIDFLANGGGRGGGGSTDVGSTGGCGGGGRGNTGGTLSLGGNESFNSYSATSSITSITTMTDVGSGGNTTNKGGGGGGGATSSLSKTAFVRAGGAGTAINFEGINVSYFCGGGTGGAGAAALVVAGGSGVGGNGAGSDGNATNGVANTGSGGGGCYWNGSATPGNGGSGSILLYVLYSSFV